MPDLVTPALPAGTLRDHRQPTLVAGGDRTLRPWQPTDVAALVAAYEDPAIRHWHVRTLTRAEATGWITAAAAGWSAETRAQWAVVDEHDTLLGRVGINDLDLADACGELGYWTVAAARGRAVATRAVTALTRWMVEDVGFHRVEIEHSVHNVASCRVAESSGFGWRALGGRPPCTPTAGTTCTSTPGSSRDPSLIDDQERKVSTALTNCAGSSSHG